MLRCAPVVIYLFEVLPARFDFVFFTDKYVDTLCWPKLSIHTKPPFLQKYFLEAVRNTFCEFWVILAICWQMDMCDVVVRKWLWLPRECTLTLKYGFLQTHTRENKLNRITIFANKNLVGFMVEDGSMQIANIALFVRKFPWQDEFFCKGRRR